MTEKRKRRSLVFCRCGEKWEMVGGTVLVNGKHVTGYWCLKCDTLKGKGLKR